MTWTYKSNKKKRLEDKTIALRETTILHSGIALCKTIAAGRTKKASISFLSSRSVLTIFYQRTAWLPPWWTTTKRIPYNLTSWCLSTALRRRASSSLDQRRGCLANIGPAGRGVVQSSDAHKCLCGWPACNLHSRRVSSVTRGPSLQQLRRYQVLSTKFQWHPVTVYNSDASRQHTCYKTTVLVRNVASLSLSHHHVNNTTAPKGIHWELYIHIVGVVH